VSATQDTETGVIRLVDTTDTISTLVLEGEFDLDDASTVFEHCRRVLDGDRDLIVNLSDATFIDSSIVHALFKVDEVASRAGRRFVLQCATDTHVQRVLSITDASEKLATATTCTDAIALIESGRRR
jgi:anti-sigma B factor antagonist